MLNLLNYELRDDYFLYAARPEGMVEQRQEFRTEHVSEAGILNVVDSLGCNDIASHAEKSIPFFIEADNEVVLAANKGYARPPPVLLLDPTTRSV